MHSNRRNVTHRQAGANSVVDPILATPPALANRTERKRPWSSDPSNHEPFVNAGFRRNSPREVNIATKECERGTEGFEMARLARVVAVDVPHHVTQRGNARRFMLDCDADRRVYLGLLREHIEGCRGSLIGYCLMSNHVQLVLIPKEPKALARALRHTHGRYASYWKCCLPFQRPCLAGTLLFLPVRRGASLGGITLHRTESRTSRIGDRC